MAVNDQAALHFALFIVRLVFTVVLLCITLSLFALKPKSTQSDSQSPITSVVLAVQTPRRSLIITLLSLVALTYFLDGFALIVHSVISKTWQGTPKHHWWTAQWSGLEVESLGGLLATGLLAIIGVWKENKGVDVWLKRRVKIWAFIALAGTIAEIGLLVVTIDFLRKQPISIPELPPITQPYVPNVLHSLFPLLRLLILIPLYPSLAYPHTRYVPASDIQEGGIAAQHEESSLLEPSEQRAAPSQGLAPVQNQQQYGTFGSGRTIGGSNTGTGTHTPSEGLEPAQPLKPGQSSKSDESINKADTPSWSEMYRRLKRISPYLWPKKSVKLQFLAFLCMILLVAGRFINVALPLTLGALLSIFEDQYSGKQPSTPQPHSPWPYLLAYVGLRFLQSSGGLGALRDTLWAPVMQYSDREMSEMTFAHLLSLSLSFHTRRKTGEVLRILDRGAAINRVFQLLLFNIFPTFLDITIALGVFVWKFGWELAIIVFFVMFAYVAASIVLTTWRTKIRREMNDRDVITRGIHTDCLLNYETVKYFGGEAFEGERYSDAIKEYQVYEYRVAVSLNLLNLVQNLIISTGLLVGSFIVALRVTRYESNPSEFVVFITYLAQLYGPLNQLGFIYRSINTSLVDTERLMKLLDEPTEVNDKPGAPDLEVDDGEIEFENVTFTYDDRTTALKGVSFKVPAGSSVALVGESGSGKSTVLRLLYRFYDLKDGEGRILIDGKDIRDVTQLSLRKAIGVVPQDSVLFNASISYNIGYGKFGSTDDEIETAAKAAQMHDRILSFPQGYETKVGERGVRLSGGEKQRVAIARTLLKNPPILLLDEATSALDTSTEKDIQKALQNLVKGRSSLSIAHRLSTIASADLILVLKDGKIVEQGTHRELLVRDGVFAAMWANQITTEDADGSIMKKEEDTVVGYDLTTNLPQNETQIQTQNTGNVSGEIEQPRSVDVDAEVEQDENRDGALAVDNDERNLEYTTDTVAVEKTPETLSDEPAPMNASDVSNAPIAPTSYAAAAAVPPGDNAAVVQKVPPAQPIPSSTTVVPAVNMPIAFPTGDDTASQRTASVADVSVTASVEGLGGGTRPMNPVGPSVTFGAGVNTPPRSGTPDQGGSEATASGKRKRISSQNFQKFARRISIGQMMGSKRSGSSGVVPTTSSIAAGNNNAVSPARSEEGGVGRISIGERTRSESRMSIGRRTESPASSVTGGGDEDGRKGRDKDKKRKGSIFQTGK